MLKTLLGNETLKQNLLAALAAGKLSHSVLLCGEAGTGTGFAARCLAADYLYPNGGEGARQVMNGQGAEVLLVQGEGVSGDIKIDRIRTVRRELFNTAISAEGRVVLVQGAHKMNAPSANALLKVLEEPPQGVLFILTAPGEGSVLPTIRSRCNIYTLAPVSSQECAQYLRTQYPGEKADELAQLFGGKIGSAVHCICDEGAKQQLEHAKQLADAVQNKDIYAALVLMAAYEKDRTAARSLLSYTAQLCSASLRGVYPFLQAQNAAACLPFLAQAAQALAANVSPKLVLTCLAGDVTA